MHLIGRRIILFSCLVIPLIAVSGEPGSREATGALPRASMREIAAKFTSPPSGYGEVAFYWWLGDTLTQDRLLWELDRLKGKGVVGLQVNYAHSDSGGLMWGLTLPSQPKLFSEKWWDLFGWFMREANKRGIAVSLSDYTLGIGQGASVDEALAENPDLAGSELRCGSRIVRGPGRATWNLPGDPLALKAYRVGPDSLPLPGPGKDLAGFAAGRLLEWSPEEGTWMIACVWAERIVASYDPMNQRAGSEYVRKFFQRFEQRFPGQSGKGINYFFSDELSFRLQYPIWDDGFAGEFAKRKGYDIRPHLPALFIDTGPETPRIRLDYNDVMVSLSEEHYFRPLYRWHQDHGMTFGCDHGGRGKDVAEFGDYFRTVRWNQGPGCDQPRLAQDIVKDKVASSIAHLYLRPRVWLEGFHSSGWSTSSAQVADAVFGNFVMGQNLLTFHGLYYSTHGGWWEWAPPCNHFRMPYWEHIDPLMHAVQRLSYILTQGTHRCDVAILYPVEPVIARTGGEESVAAAFSAGEALYNAGIDFDFVDYQSLARSTVEGGRISVSGEEYRVLVIPSMKTIRFASLEKSRDLLRSGGIVVNLGSTPEASERGRGDRKFEFLRRSLFGAANAAHRADELLRTGPHGGAVYRCSGSDSLSRLVSGLFPRDFAVVSPSTERLPRVMHRRVKTSDIYAVYNLPRGTECFFRSSGRAEVWNPWTGDRLPLLTARPVRNGTILPLPLSEYDVQLIVFSPGGNDAVVESSTLSSVDSVRMLGGKLTLWGESTARGKGEARVMYRGSLHTLSGDITSPAASRPLAGPWEFEVHPVLDNRWGDFHWPPTPELIGPEVRRFEYRETPGPGDARGTLGDTVSCSFGPQFWELGPLPGIIEGDTLLDGRTIDPCAGVSFHSTTYRWHPYSFSWRWGVENDPGHQGYHGLKEEVNDEFIRLGKMALGYTMTERQPEEGGTCYCLSTGVIAPRGGTYRLEAGRVRPASIRINGLPVDPSSGAVHLEAGCNTLLLWYDRPCVTYFVLHTPGTPRRLPEETGKPLAMRWYADTTVLRFDTRYGRDDVEGWYRFMSPPGMYQMHVVAHGTIGVDAGGRPLPVTRGLPREDGAREYLIDIGGVLPTPVEVVIRIRQERGYYAGAAVPEPVRIDCGKGVFIVGDWSLNDALHAYSGGAWYRTHVRLSPAESAQKVELDLGSVVSTAAVRVNGLDAGLRVSPPWVYDISKCIHAGDNDIGVLVYNTAANHYTSIPTRYGGPVTSGIIGPVTVRFTCRAVLKDQ